MIDYAGDFFNWKCWMEVVDYRANYQIFAKFMYHSIFPWIYYEQEYRQVLFIQFQTERSHFKLMYPGICVYASFLAAMQNSFYEWITLNWFNLEMGWEFWQKVKTLGKYCRLKLRADLKSFCKLVSCARL